MKNNAVFNLPDETNLCCLTADEHRDTVAKMLATGRLFHSVLSSDDEVKRLLTQLREAVSPGGEVRDEHGLPYAISTMDQILLFAAEVEPDRNILLALLFFPFVAKGSLKSAEIAGAWGEDVAYLIDGLCKVSEFERRNTSADQDNFRGLLLSLARDIRVIIARIVGMLALMRSINLHPHEQWVRSTAFEANCLYAQLAHRLGLYKIKGELEDLSLKYTNRDIYTRIAANLNAKKRERDAYIASFIQPLKRKLEDAGLRFDIKGRTKSISSIWAKIRKQKTDMDHIYDLFAIRVIIDTPPEREKADCWLAYSVLADMYTANPARMRDWITIPKSNGYESLHATVMGPGQKWVEVQFRTRRMDLVAEKGLAAHWRYKGGHGDSTDQWMNNIRDILESADSGPMELMRNMRIDSFDSEVFAFTPKGDLFRLPAGSTVLDFAFAIHSNVGCRCVGAVVNSRHEKITYRIVSGDTVEIVTSSTQAPKQDWLQIVITSKARNKIRQALNESRQRRAALGKEIMERRLRNRKIEPEESLMMKALKKLGYKNALDFYADIAEEHITPDRAISLYQELEAKDAQPEVRTGADEFTLRDDMIDQEDNRNGRQSVLVIGDRDIKGLNYKMSRCCSPVYGDDVFGFVSSDGVVKIHRKGCPNAANLRERYPYRLIKVQWSGAAADMLPVTLKVVGIDDIGIVTNITSIINKEATARLRNISIDSHDGIFQGYITIGIADQGTLTSLQRKLRTVKGVKDISRC